MSSRTILAITLVGTLAVSALAENAVYLKNGRTLTGKSVEWREGSQEYVVITADTTIPIPRAQVVRVMTDKPAEYDQAVGFVRAKLYAQAVPLLETVVRKYRMLSWDVEAAKMLTQAYLETNDAKKAVQAMETLFTLMPREQVSGTLQATYWKALLGSGNYVQLRKEMDALIGTGSPEVVASAYLMRANMFLKMGEEDSALSDFIKVTTIYPGQKAVQPEALYRAAELLDGLHDLRGDEMRKKLQKDYPTSEWATKAVTGKAAVTTPAKPAAAAPATPAVTPAKTPASATPAPVSAKKP